MPISLETVRALARLLEETDLAELTLESTPPDAVPDADNTADSATTSQSTLTRASEPSFRLTLQRAASKRNRRVADRAAAPRKAAPVASTPGTPNTGEFEIVSTSVGVFRARATPLHEGDEIKAREVVGSVEALKVPSDITTEAAGRVKSVLVTEGQGVEYGQVLFILEASSA
jgi:acetyl-CoA carboxylase biotin carboxyl carrier protein